ncbi:alkaline phosphatase family protein [Glaciecola sp. MH2013]|uniref:alkaline phosphatase D family protein n=1 Tax=Glaciecola sp. MH2013 TaxID=2785524 RepID=UPI00189D47C6|nr:alkaline phosphatase D family protein [Glaciecola sp. MH2013]MBF7072088.1 alkaline phosphatase family protein [Glaciecola sp. MH2013]
MNKFNFITAFSLIAFSILSSGCASSFERTKKHSDAKLIDNEFLVSFASCAKENRPQPIWTEIAKTNPDVFLFIGDNVYADVYEKNGKRSMQPVETRERFDEAYAMANAIPEFAAFRKQVPMMLGTWDDHDYGANDAGKEFPLKKESQQAFLDFFEFADDDPIRQQEGIYHSRFVEDEGNTVQIIMLDTRYHRDPITKNPAGRPKNKGPYLQIDDPNATILGEAQWQWLEEELKKPADVRLIVSSIQVVAYEHSWESWGIFPHQRNKLYDMITNTKANGVVFLTGDRHLMEISKDTGQLGHQVPYPLWDFTSSDIVRDFTEVNEDNSFRQGRVVRDTNFGEVKIEWADKLADSVITLTARGRDGGVLNQQVVSLKDLQAF